MINTDISSIMFLVFIFNNRGCSIINSKIYKNTELIKKVSSFSLVGRNTKYNIVDTNAIAPDMINVKFILYYNI